MAEVLLHVLGSCSDAGSRADVDRAGGAGACLLLGEESRGRSSLLFLAAAEAAGRGGGRVLFLAPRPVQALPAPLLPLEPAGLRRIEFAYPRTAGGLLRALAALHRDPRGGLPSLLLLDGLDRYLQGVGGQEAARIAALLRDTAGWLSQQQQPGAGCHIIAALKAPIPEETGSDSFLPIIERYFPVKCLVREEPCEPEGVQRYLISFSGLATHDAEGPPESQNVEDCTWELLYEADKVTGIRLVPRQAKQFGD
ncbi:ATPase SWSAP1 [Hemiscyllium ocellatum]|uniref:ATPase SWSAP1 n=1 Tax=Hemiscyllium ocellatum TaxID=170820 RepID=UPI0029662204|nr:ATPase SWSAP1 [Hemiscyllium ocellatum]